MRQGMLGCLSDRFDNLFGRLNNVSGCLDVQAVGLPGCRLCILLLGCLNSLSGSLHRYLAVYTFRLVG